MGHRERVSRAAYRERLLAAARTYLGGVCTVCSTVDDLEFDHVNPADKIAEVSALLGNTSAFWAEVEKCQLLCVEDHKVKTAAERLARARAAAAASRPKPADLHSPAWRVVRTVLNESTSATALRGRALLLGSSVTAYCMNRSESLTATLGIMPIDGRLVCNSLTVLAVGHRAVKSVDLHRVPIDALIREAFASLDDDTWAAQRATDAPGRLDDVVAAWITAQCGSDAHRATAAVAEQLGLSRGYVSRLLTQARNEGLLPR